jgi:Fe-S cluster assembly ATP-binding protein
MSSISVQNLHASINGQEILRGLDIEFSQGEVHAVMGPNGSGKSTLAKVMAGHPDYEVTAGDILLNGESVLEMEPDERARKGLFMAFQYPIEIPGVSNANFLRAALQARLPEGEELDATDFYHRLYEKMDLLEMKREFTARAVNEGFSGGEKKRNEILQLAILEPAFAVLDETDSGLDIDALKVVANIVPDFVHVMHAGKIVRSGGKELALELESKGYDWLKEENNGAAPISSSEALAKEGASSTVLTN